MEVEMLGTRDPALYPSESHNWSALAPRCQASSDSTEQPRF